MNRGVHRYHTAGFTLIEVLVALAIAAIAFGTLFSIYSTALDRGDESTAKVKAVAVARSILAEVGTRIPLVDGERAGQTNGIPWKVSIQPYADTDDSALSTAKSHQVSVTVFWDDAARTLSLTTLRLAVQR